jgi:hypothetical protein
MVGWCVLKRAVEVEVNLKMHEFVAALILPRWRERNGRSYWKGQGQINCENFWSFFGFGRGRGLGDRGVFRVPFKPV